MGALFLLCYWIPPDSFTRPPKGMLPELSVHPVNGYLTGYTIVRYEHNIPVATNTVSVNQTSFTDSSSAPDDYTSFTVSATYSGGYLSSPSVSQEPLVDPHYTTQGFLVRGQGGGLYLVVSAIPQNVRSIRVFYIHGDTPYPIYSTGLQPQQDYTLPIYASGPNHAYFDVPVTNFVNGIYQIKPSQLSPYGVYGPDTLYTQAIGADGKVGNISFLSLSNFGGGGWRNIPFLDGRQFLKTNINFLLKAANVAYPFSFYVENAGGSATLESQYGSNTYIYSGLCYEEQPPVGTGPRLNEFKPFEDNYLYVDFTYANASNVLYDTAFPGPKLFGPTNLFGTYNFVPNTNLPALAPFWGQSSSAWGCVQSWLRMAHRLQFLLRILRSKREY